MAWIARMSSARLSRALPVLLCSFALAACSGDVENEPEPDVESSDAGIYSLNDVQADVTTDALDEVGTDVPTDTASDAGEDTVIDESDASADAAVDAPIDTRDADEPDRDMGPTYFSVTVTLEGDGQVTSDPPGLDCPTACSAEFVANTDVTLSATPASDPAFAGWQGACEGRAPCMVTTSGDLAVEARFVARGSPLWAEAFGGPGGDSGREMAIDSQGFIYVAGVFYETVDAGGLALISAGEADILLAKYAPDGEHIWSQSFGGAGVDHVAHLLIDDDTLWLGGQFSDTINFGSGAHTSAGESDLYVARFDMDGNNIDTHVYGGVGVDKGMSIGLDPLGNIYLAGAYTDAINFGGDDLESAGGQDAFLAKFDSSFAPLWSRSYGGTSDADAFVTPIVVDELGNVFAGGFFAHTVMFGDEVIEGESADGLITHINSAGEVQWVSTFGSPQYDTVRHFWRGNDGRLFVVGYVGDGADFGDGEPVSGEGSKDGFVAAYDSSGTLLWAQTIGGEGFDDCWSVTTDSEGRVYAGCMFEGTGTIDGNVVTSNGGGDTLLVAFDEEGSRLWHWTFGGDWIDGHDSVMALSVSPTGELIATGRFSDTITLGDTTLTSEDEDGHDAYLMSIVP